MRGADEMSGSLFSYVDLEARISGQHPLRKMRQVRPARSPERRSESRNRSTARTMAP